MENKILVSSQSNFAKEELNDKNHLSNKLKLLHELVGLDYDLEDDDSDLPFSNNSSLDIERWTCEFYNEFYQPLDIIVYNNYWIPLIEYNKIMEVISEFSKDQKVINIAIGYIEGTKSRFAELGNQSGLSSSGLIRGYNITVYFNLMKWKIA